jgi:ThiF family
MGSVRLYCAKRGVFTSLNKHPSCQKKKSFKNKDLKRDFFKHRSDCKRNRRIPMCSNHVPVSDKNCRDGMTANKGFEYASAYSRNFGWVTATEQAVLRKARVAIAGLGGVGGAHAATLARLGIANMCIADFDSFDVHNINRQAGAFVSTFGQTKIDVVERMVRDINPETQLRLMPDGVTAGNVDEFLHGVDVYVDGLDFFALPARRLFLPSAGKKVYLHSRLRPWAWGWPFFISIPKG